VLLNESWASQLSLCIAGLGLLWHKYWRASNFYAWVNFCHHVWRKFGKEIWASLKITFQKKVIGSLLSAQNPFQWHIGCTRKVWYHKTTPFPNYFGGHFHDASYLLTGENFCRVWWQKLAATLSGAINYHKVKKKIVYYKGRYCHQPPQRDAEAEWQYRRFWSFWAQVQAPDVAVFLVLREFCPIIQLLLYDLECYCHDFLFSISSTNMHNRMPMIDINFRHCLCLRSH